MTEPVVDPTQPGDPLVRELERAVRRAEARANSAEKAAIKANQRAITSRRRADAAATIAGEIVVEIEASGIDWRPASMDALRSMAAMAPPPRLGVRPSGKPPPLRTMQDVLDALARLRRKVARGMSAGEALEEAQAIVSIGELINQGAVP